MRIIIIHNLLKKLIILVFSAGVIFPAFALNGGSAVTADKIKAAYTFQFTKFVVWPDSSSTEKPFTICILGNEPIGKQLEPLNQRKIGERSITVKNIKTISKADDCNILYIAETESERLNDIFRFLHKKPILTVSSIPDFALQGGIIGLVSYKKKIRLEINLSSARSVDIKLSAKLLEIASVVDGVGNKEEQP